MESLYRKYRPLTFESVVGQAHIVSTLEHAVVEGRLSHAYLFCGPRGTGKTTMARILAKALLCEKAPAAREQGAAGCMPDGTCEECRQIAEGTHPDVYELDAASRTGVDNVREEIIGSVNFAPVRGAYKVYIIDEVHMLTTAAFNALLKTLEEPPSHVVFVLCTTDPQKIPETILSRCQRFDFHRIGNDDIMRRLAYICEQEGFSYDDEALRVVAKHARGGMRDALSTLEQLSVFGAGSVHGADARALLGEVSGAVLGDFSRAIAARDAAALFALVREQVDDGGDLMELTRDLVAHVRDIYMVRVAGAQGGAPDASPDEIAALEDEAALFEGTDRLARILTVLDDAALEMRNAPDVRLVLEIALTRLARPEADLTLEALAERVERLEARLASGVPAAPVDAHALTALAGAGSPRRDPSRVPEPAPESSVEPAPSTRPDGASPAVPAPSQEDSVRAQGLVQTEGPAPEPAPEPARESMRRPAPESVSVPAHRSVPEPEPALAAAHPAAAKEPVSAQRAAAVREAEPAPAAPAGADAVRDAGELQRRWSDVVHRVTAAQPSRGALLQSSRALRDDGDTLTVGLPAGSAFAIKMLGREDTQSVVSPQVSAVFGPRKIAYTMGDAPASAPRPAPAPADRMPPSAPLETASGAARASASVDAAPMSPAPAAAPASEPVPAPAPQPAQPVAPAAPSPGAAEVLARPQAAAAQPSEVDQVSGPTVVPEPTVDEDRRAWEDDVVPYDDAFIEAYEQDEDLPPFDMPSSGSADEEPAREASASPAAPFVPFAQASQQQAQTSGPAFTPTSAAAAAFADAAPASAAPQSVDEAKEMLGSIFGAGVIFKGVD